MRLGVPDTGLQHSNFVIGDFQAGPFLLPGAYRAGWPDGTGGRRQQYRSKQDQRVEVAIQVDFP